MHHIQLRECKSAVDVTDSWPVSENADQRLFQKERPFSGLLKGTCITFSSGSPHNALHLSSTDIPTCAAPHVHCSRSKIDSYPTCYQ